MLSCPPFVLPRRRTLLLVSLLAMLLGGCATTHPPTTSQAVSAEACPPTTAPRPACPVCPATEPVKPAAPPLEAARWQDLPSWPGSDGLAPVLNAFLSSCSRLQQQPGWKTPCDAAKTLDKTDEAGLQRWFEQQFQPWQLVNPDGSREGLITGYYEPILNASRHRKPPYLHPVYGVPEDLIVVELSALYPELKHLRLRGRLEGRKLLPYYTRSDWGKQTERRKTDVLLWADDPLDVFFMQIQGSGQVQLDDGNRIRLGYADQNGQPYRSIGRWLIDQGELKPEQASMQGIRRWLKAHPQRMEELLGSNPSYVYFRELPLKGEGPPGAMGLALTPERSLAIDPRTTPLGVPVWLVTTFPNSERALTRLMVAQDTGGAIRGVVRADFYWGSGVEAGNQAGRMRQKGQMWLLLPKGVKPDGATITIATTQASTQAPAAGKK